MPLAVAIAAHPPEDAIYLPESEICIGELPVSAHPADLETVDLASFSGYCAPQLAHSLKNVDRAIGLNTTVNVLNRQPT